MNSNYTTRRIFEGIIFLTLISTLTNDQSRRLTTFPSIHREISDLLQKAKKSNSYSLTQGNKEGNEALRLSLISKNDSFIVNSQICIGQNLSLQGKNKEALVFFEKAIYVSKKANYSYGLCNALLETGSIEYLWGNYNNSYAYFRQALDLANHKHYINIQAIANNYIGKYFHAIGQFEKSVTYYQRSIQLHTKNKNSRQSATVLLSLGKTYLNEGDVYKALQCYLDAYKSFENTNELLSFSGVCNHLGSIYLAMGLNDKALEYHHKALAFRTFLGNPEGMAKSFNNLGETFLQMNNLDSAAYYFAKSSYLCIETGYKKGLVKVLINQGKIYLAKNNQLEASKYLRKALHLAIHTGYSAGIAEASVAIGNYYRHTKQYDKAISYYKESFKNSESSNLKELYPEIYQGLYECFHIQNNLIEEHAYYVLLTEAEKTKLIAKSNQQLAELRIVFESENKEKDNQVLRKENELNEMTIKRKSALIWLIISALAFTALLCAYIYHRFNDKRRANKILESLNHQIRIQNQKLEILNNELEQANKEKDKILSIIAHELRNPLYWFQNLAETLSKRYTTMPPEKVQKSLVSLDESAKNAFHLMDNLLHWSRSRLNRITPHHSSHSLETLINESTRMFESILNQKKISLFANIPSNAHIHVDSNLFTCVVRNLISNAIKFTPEKGLIDIDCIADEKQYTLVISDSGIGIPSVNMDILFDPDQSFSIPGLLNEQGSGFGLKLCKEFVEMNGGLIWASSEEGKGTRFTFTIPRA